MSRGVWIAWSGGKDSALTFFRLRQQGFSIAGLISVVVGSPPLVPFHGIPVTTLQQQAQALGIRLTLLRFRQLPSDALYARRFRAHLRSLGCQALAFGDIFLEDVRRYREAMVERLALQLLFPLWGNDPHAVAEEVVQNGIQAVITCVDIRQLSPEWLGKAYDAAFLRALPPSVDPCGERGEFHTCVLALPGFRSPLTVHGSSPIQWAEHWHGCVLTTSVS